MDRIEDLSKIKVREDSLLCLVKENKPKSDIILLDEAKESTNTIDYMEVICVGAKITDVEVGDIVLYVDGNIKQFGIDGKLYGNVVRYLCPIIVDKDNFKLEG